MHSPGRSCAAKRGSCNEQRLANAGTTSPSCEPDPTAQCRRRPRPWPSELQAVLLHSAIPPDLDVRVQQRCRSALPPPQVISIDNAVPRLVDVDHESLALSLWACACRFADVFRWPQRAVLLEYPDRLPDAKGTIVGGAHLNSESACW